MYDYHLFEDNAGYLHLAVLNDDSTCVYYLVDNDRDFVRDTLADLIAGGDPIADGWEGGEDDPAASYAAIRALVDARNGSAWEIGNDANAM